MEDYHKLRFLAQPLSVLCFLPTLFHQKYDFARLIRFLFTFRCWVGSLQFRTTLSNIPFPIYQGILPCCFPVSSHVPWFSPIFPRLNFPLFSSETFLTIRQNSLYVTVCMIARTFFKVTLSTRLAPCITTRLTGDYRDRTYTGKCSPALLDTHKKKGAFAPAKPQNFSTTKPYIHFFPIHPFTCP